MARPFWSLRSAPLGAVQTAEAQVLERIVETGELRVALAGAPEQASERLAQLLERLSLMLVKGELVAPDVTAPEPD